MRRKEISRDIRPFQVSPSAAHHVRDCGRHSGNGPAALAPPVEARIVLLLTACTTLAEIVAVDKSRLRLLRGFERYGLLTEVTRQTLVP